MKPMNDANVILRRKLFNDGIISTPKESEEYWPVHLTYSGKRIPSTLNRQQYELICTLFYGYKDKTFYGGGVWGNKIHNMMCIAADPDLFTRRGAKSMDIKHGLVLTSSLRAEDRGAVRAFCNRIPEIIPWIWLIAFTGLYNKLWRTVYDMPRSPYDQMPVIDAYKLLFTEEFMGEPLKIEGPRIVDITDQVL